MWFPKRNDRDPEAPVDDGPDRETGNPEKGSDRDREAVGNGRRQRADRPEEAGREVKIERGRKKATRKTRRRIQNQETGGRNLLPGDPDHVRGDLRDLAPKYREIMTRRKKGSIRKRRNRKTISTVPLTKDRPRSLIIWIFPIRRRKRITSMDYTGRQIFDTETRVWNGFWCHESESVVQVIKLALVTEIFDFCLYLRLCSFACISFFFIIYVLRNKSCPFK